MNVEALEPDGADANVNCYSGLGCGLDEVIGALPMRDCCLGQGFSFSTFSEVCTTCVGKNNPIQCLITQLSVW